MSRLRAYAQLVRLPNVFTALADIGLGALAAGAASEHLEPWFWRSLACLVLASACFYCGGMVLNDYFDIEQDRKERPHRPIPSGRVSPTSALHVYQALLLAALAFSYLSCYHGSEWNGTAIVVAGLLMASIQLYDCWLKRLWLGPILMGACRFWNVLLGLTLLSSLEAGWPFHMAGVVGLYIIAVTWFARTEARISRRSMLRAAAMVMVAALALALPLPLWFSPGTSSVLFPYLLVGLGFIVGFPVTRAIAEPKPALVQAAVKRSIMGLVVLDATLATVPAGAWGLLLLLLLVPALYLGRWIYST